jgi:hypothetical protein
MLQELLRERNLPALRSREEMLEIMQREVYGYLPPKPESVTFEDAGKIHPSISAGRASCDKIIAHCVVGGRTFDFPFAAILPLDGQKHPFFVYLSFDSNIPDRYLPAEELVDNGFGVLVVNHKDVSSDDSDMTNGMSGFLFGDGKRNPTDPGKIAMWAWATQRVLDFAETQSACDMERAIVCGHSRLGKTALLAAATDTRFTIGYSNNSGCTGAAISRGKEGETLTKITNRFPYWFCEKYLTYKDNEEALPLDQHFLIASIAPRCALVGSGTLDAWADPVSEQLGCAAASAAFEKPFSGMERPARIADEFFDGDIGYHLRRGDHYYSREDWQKLIRFIFLHR